MDAAPPPKPSWTDLDDDALMSTAEVAKALNYSVSGLLKLVQRKVLNPTSLGGGSFRFRVGDLKALLEKRRKWSKE